MPFRIASTILAVLLFVAYFAPIVLKLKQLPLALVVAGGITLVVIDAWQAIRERD